MDAELLPNVLGLVGRELEGPRSIATFYRIIRNIPSLCGFPSRERKMLHQLEAENQALKQQNEQLLAEIHELRSSKRFKA